MIQPRTWMLGVIQTGTRIVIQRFVISYSQKRKTTSVLDQSLNHVIAAAFLCVIDRRGQDRVLNIYLP